MAKSKQIIDERELVLQDAIKATCGDRDSTYGSPAFQLNCAAALVESYRKARLASGHQRTTAHDIAIEDALVKISRIACGKPHRDNYTDAAAYLAIAWEVLSLEEKKAAK